jgi:hypothetical protein
MEMFCGILGIVLVLVFCWYLAVWLDPEEMNARKRAKS